jgi:hypothetical protein
MLPMVVVDPSVIWMIDSMDGADVADSILSALEWMNPNAGGPLDIVFSRRGIEALTVAGAFPAEPRLNELLTSMGLSHIIAAKTLAGMVSRFMANNNYIEDVVGLQDVLYHSTEIEPDPSLVITNPDLQTLSVDSIGLVALCAQEGRHQLSYGFPRQGHEHCRIQAATHITILELFDCDRADKAVKVDLDVLRSPSAWSCGLSSLQIWRDADCSNDLEVAIWLKAMELTQQSGCGLRAFRVGTEFLQTLAKCEAAGAGVYAEPTLTKCAQLLLLQSNLDPRPFRSSADTNASVRQRQRDKAKAWRLHVTSSHQALRLMYWELATGEIEFATLGPKVDEVIHEGNALEPRAWSV